MSFIALIPARSGSKGVVNKNIRLINGKELIYWSIKSALNSKFIKKVIVSTDSNKIAKIARSYGAEVPFLRPKNISKNNSNTIDTVLHLFKNYDLTNFKYLILLQPTSPFRDYKSINKAIKLFNTNSLNSLTSVTKSKKNKKQIFEVNKKRINFINAKYFNNIRRQDLKDNYYINGAIYINKISELIRNKKFITKYTIPFEMNALESIDIDDNIDLKISSILGRHILK
tara:strand:+ start:262 stop:945 length:684 start_codon:yes stop_codon:yes gene_type:complete